MFLLILIGAASAGGCALFVVSRKWCLPTSRTVPIIALCSLVAIAAVAFLGIGPQWVFIVSVWLLQGAGFVGIVLWQFYRDPERDVPIHPDAIVSPADGRVIYVRELAAGEPLRADKNAASMILHELRGTRVAGQALWQVGISMVFTDVHVNRAPIDGRLVVLHHRPVRFLSLRASEALNLNERQTMVLENGHCQVAIVQIASRLVRQIVSYSRLGETIVRGQRIGMIRFGSQVDLFVPVVAVSDLHVRVGQRLVAGETIVCRMRQRSNAPVVGA